VEVGRRVVVGGVKWLWLDGRYDARHPTSVWRQVSRRLFLSLSRCLPASTCL
jgi:hypothetical protein